MTHKQQGLEQVLEISRYINHDVCRATLQLRTHQQGYNNGRPISLNKQQNLRNDETNYCQERMKIAKPMYRLLFATQLHLTKLADRMKETLKLVGFIFQEQKGNKLLVQNALVELLDQIYTQYRNSKVLQEEQQMVFEKNLKQFASETSIPLIVTKIDNPHCISQLFHLFFELDEHLDRVMTATLRTEEDMTKQRYEYGTFIPIIQEFTPPNYQFDWKYDLDIIHELDEKDDAAQQRDLTLEVRQNREEVNYAKVFVEKFKDKLLKASPEYSNLLVCDLMDDLANRSLTNEVLEVKFYRLLNSVEATQFLLVYRSEIVHYLKRRDYWSQSQGNQKKPATALGGQEKTSNHQVLEKLGIDVKADKSLGLKKQELKGQQDRKLQSKEDGLAIFKPEDFEKLDQRQLVRWFPSLTKSERPEFTFVKIEPLPRKQIDTSDLKKITSLPPWTQQAFEGTNSLNVIQSKIFDKAFGSDQNLLVCAPTGAGKTNIALLAILQEIRSHVNQETKRLIDHDFKIVYISPMKALASEIVEKFSTKLRYLGIKVKEFTGDMQLSKRELSETHIILTTPEKWDVITRKTNQISEQLKLLIIDEVHLLNDERGPILECVVARTLMQVERAQRHIRLVGLSATLPNYWDVAVFLSCQKDGVFYFDQTFRPVPLAQKFIGVKDPCQAPGRGVRRRTKRDVQNDQAYEVLRECIRKNKQVLVFVHSRKETVKYAQWIYEKATKNSDGYVIQNTTINCNKVNDAELKKLLPAGLGCHHAGMLRADRNFVERHFLNGEIRCLVATATLAWGVNLPAYAVIIKGTDIYDASRADMQNLSVLDVQQMFGRAGRPQFDNQGEATLITDFINMGHYMGMLNNASYIESKLLSFLKEALNAEIVLGNITNYTEAYNWLNHTFLAIRMRRNPLHYGVQREHDDIELNCDLLVSEKIDEALKQLNQLKLVRYDQRNSLVTSTELGRIASHYYVKCETMKILCEEMKLSFDTNDNHRSRYFEKTIFEMLKIVAKAKEFDQIRLRPDELKDIKKIFDDYWVFDDLPGVTFDTGRDDQPEEIVIQNEEKVIALISGYIAQVPFENYALVMDTHVVIQNAIRLCRCMFEMALKKNQAHMTLTLLKLCKLVENRMHESSSPLHQFSREIFQGFNSRKLVKAKNEYISPMHLQAVRYYLDEHPDTTAQDMLDLDDKTIVAAMKVHHTQVSHFKQYLKWLPCIEVEHTIKPISATILQIVVIITPKWDFSNKWHMKNETFWIIVDDNEEILHSESLAIDQESIQNSYPVQSSFFVPYKTKAQKYVLNVTSDRWIMRHEPYYEIDLTHLGMEEEQLTYTELLDLQPLPTQALSSSEFEALYPYKYFNPIQTQVFHSLYHTDDNVLIGAPTGSGKTIMAEFAMLRVFRTQPNLKIIYIAPLKAIAKERLKDWSKRLGQLKKSVLELTGDFTPDLAALLQANVLITTPEKWDGITRSWHTRQYVKEVALLIFDEIHLLGADRGPVLEVIVSRMNAIAGTSNQKTRLVGLSTAMANGEDVSRWFGVKRHKFFNFKPSCRPVPVTIHFNGFEEKAYCPRMATMNKPCYQDIKRYSEGKPTIIFVSSRRQTRLTALDLIAMATFEGNEKQYLMVGEAYLMEQYVKRVEDELLRQTLAYGIGMHHSGLGRTDREIVEELFVGGKIQLLIATSTVAWGVNFPARLVIVKGTEYFDPKQKKYVDLPLTDLLQMIGRAGRPQFDTQATACVYVEQSKKTFYRKYLNSPFPIESSLLQQISDHVNAEIQGGVITNENQFIDWITWTYFFRRLSKNPSYYNCKKKDRSTIKLYLQDLVEKTIKELVGSGCVAVEESSYVSTNLGKLSSLYYLKHQTMKHYNTKLNNNNKLEELLKILAYSVEFEEQPVRHNEDNLNALLNEKCRFKGDLRKMGDPNEKTFLLLQSHLFRLPVPIKDFEIDTKLVLDSCLRMVHCMIDLSAEKGYLQTVLRGIKLMQMLVQGFWEDNQDIIKNVPFCSHLSMPNVKTVKDLQGQFKQVVKFIQENVQPQEKQQEALKAVKQIPNPEVKHTIQDGKYQVNMYDKFYQGSNRVMVQKLTKVKDAAWWFILVVDEKIVGFKKALHQQRINKEFELPPDYTTLRLHVHSDSFIDLGFEF